MFGLVLAWGLNNYILNNHIINNGQGIYLQKVNNTSIICNVIKSNNANGIYLDGSSNSIINNIVTGNGYYGIGIYGSNNNIVNNTIENNGWSGLILEGSINNVMDNNITNNKFDGIVLMYSGDSNIVTSNNIANNRRYGIYVRGSNKNKIRSNTVENNDIGIDLFGSNYNRIINNTIAANRYGLYVNRSSVGNIIFHNNFILNAVNAYVIKNSTGNVWDNGYPSGGNYWSDYQGTDHYSGPYQNETGGDGIGDTPYLIHEHDVDLYPLMKPKNMDVVKLDVELPNNILVVNKTTTIIIHNISSNTKLYIYLNNTLIDTLVTIGNQTLKHDVKIPLIDEGSYVLRIIGYRDRKLYVYNTSVNVIIDNSPPHVEIISPVDGSCVSGTINIEFQYSDEHLESVELIVDHMIINVKGNYSYQLDTRNLSDGEHVIVLKATDLAGNTAEYAITIIVDNTAPLVKLVSPSNGSYTRGIVDVRYIVNDPHLDKAVIIIGNLTIDITGTHSYRLNTTKLPDNVYKLTLYANDTLGHESVDSITIIVDNTPPVTEIISPSNGSYVSGLVTVTFECRDEHFYQALLYIDNLGVNITSENNYTLNTTQLDDGKHTISLKAIDRSGNINYESITIIVDNTAPKIAVEGVVDSKLVVLSNALTLTYNIEDTYFESAALHIFNKVIPLSKSGTVTINISTVPNGTYQAYIVALDKAGNIANVSFTLYVEKLKTTPTITANTNSASTITAPTTTVSDMGYNTIIIIMVLFISMVTLIVLIILKKTKI